MLFYEMELRRIREGQSYREETVRRIIEARRFIDQRFSEPLSIDRIARHSCLSRFELVRQFRKHYGNTPWQYLTAQRLRHAASLLGQGMKVADACYEVGFGSPTSFAGLFRKSRRVSPAQYRRTAKKQYPRGFTGLLR